MLLDVALAASLHPAWRVCLPMPRGRGATRPGRGSVSRDGANPIEENGEALREHAAKVGIPELKVKLGPPRRRYLFRRSLDWVAPVDKRQQACRPPYACRSSADRICR